MAQETQSLRTADRMRSKLKMEFVRTGIDAAGKPFVMRANLPVGRGFNEKGQPQEYLNLEGQKWEPADVYDARINSQQAAAKRVEAAKEAEATKTPAKEKK